MVAPKNKLRAMRRFTGRELSWLKRGTHALMLIGCMVTTLSAQSAEDYYHIEKVKIPSGIELEVGGLAFDDQGNLGIATRRGEIWLVTDPDSERPSYARYAHGLHEPLGLNWKDGSFYCAQRGELTKLTDTDGDGKADKYECLYDWDLAGNYHEYSYGPVFTPEGDMLVTLNLGWIGRGASQSEWRGWLVKISPDGKLTPIATGLRSPAGFGYNKNGDIFYTENQGDWVGSGRMTHLEVGDFAGNPEGLRWTHRPESPLDLTLEDIDDTKGLTLYQYQDVFEAVKPPSVWFPHTLMGISTSGLIPLDDQFGPSLRGQLLVGDQGHSKIMRVVQEQVNGVYQGVCFPFVDGFSSGVLRLQWNPSNDALYVGMTSRGWASTGPDKFGLERLVWRGEEPFQMKTIRSDAHGFKIELTQAGDRATLFDPASYQVTDFTYQYHHFYGSPVTDSEVRTVQKVDVSADSTSFTLHLDQLRQGYIYEIKAPGVRSTAGQPLLHDFGFFTLNQIPGGGGTADDHAGHLATKEEALPAEESPKHPIFMPDDWAGTTPREIMVGTQPGLKFDIASFEVVAGERIKLTFHNDDDMLHNLVITPPGQADAVGEAALKLGLQGEAMHYVPDMEEVLYHTGVLQPETTESLYITVPDKPGVYQFVCTFPGHYLVMRGDMHVVAKKDS